jgi:cell division protein FtsB
MSFPAHLKYLMLTLLFGMFAVNSVRTTLDILESSKRLESLQSEVGALEEKKGFLERSLEYKKTEEYIEERARNALNLVRPGEEVYVSPRVMGSSSERLEEFRSKEDRPNYLLWLELFF